MLKARPTSLSGALVNGGGRRWMAPRAPRGLCWSAVGAALGESVRAKSGRMVVWCGGGGVLLLSSGVSDPGMASVPGRCCVLNYQWDWIWRRITGLCGDIMATVSDETPWPTALCRVESYPSYLLYHRSADHCLWNTPMPGYAIRTYQRDLVARRYPLGNL